MDKNNQQYEKGIRIRVEESQESEDVRRCASCGKIIVVGAECIECASKHPGTAVAGWAKWFLKKL